MKTENKHKTYKKPAIQLYVIRPNCILTGSKMTMHGNAFKGVEQSTDDDEGR